VQTILVVDDAGVVRRRFNQVLTQHSYKVIEAENGLDAVAQYKENKPDAVLLDITMPEMDGISALKEIIKLDPSARVVMVTGLGQQSIILDAIRSGAKDFVTKPCENDRLLAVLEKALT
jgi:two-component system, chemotaxis family, chemotaxis protein CheY